ncbi:MAG: flagellar basal body P-ring protein FlgI [Gemmatimonadetes bacterium]|nr:flagellar basal body P-ring protein FlgI [Gemmatimonadota bacterium]
MKPVPAAGQGRAAMAMALFVALLLIGSFEASAQTTRVRDLTINEGEVPVRLVGYGLVVGLDGTGDRVFGGSQGSMTVRSIANLLRNLGIEVPEQFIRTRNVAAVLVTAEASPYLRRGGRFEVSVASLGDASSLRGGQLWQTPLLASVGGPPVAIAQGNLLFPPGDPGRRNGPVETSAVLIDAAVALTDFGGWGGGPPSRLLLRSPDLATAQLIADAINGALGDGAAVVEDPGAVALTLPADDPMGALVQLGELTLTPTLSPRIVIDAQSGVVAVGGDISVGEAVVSHDWLTVTIAPTDAPAPAGGAAPEGAASDAGALLPPGAVRADPGIRVQALAEALHAVGATSDMMGAVFRSLRGVGALQAEVEVR